MDFKKLRPFGFPSGFQEHCATLILSFCNYFNQWQHSNVDCHALLWLVERYAEELNFRCTEKNPNGLDFDFSNAQNLEIGSTSEEKKREVFFAWDKEEQEGWLIKIERTLKVSWYRKDILVSSNLPKNNHKIFLRMRTSI